MYELPEGITPEHQEAIKDKLSAAYGAIFAVFYHHNGAVSLRTQTGEILTATPLGDDNDNCMLELYIAPSDLIEVLDQQIMLLKSILDGVSAEYGPGSSGQQDESE